MDKVNQNIARAQRKERKKGRNIAYEITWNRKDGKKVHTVISPRGIFDDNGVYKGAFAVITDITKIKGILYALQQKEKESQIRAKYLENANIALDVLIKKWEQDRKKLADNISLNVKEMIEPCLDKLKESGLNKKQRGLLNLMESNLDDLVSPFLNNLSVKYTNFTSTEIETINLIKIGKTTKEIAALQYVSPKTIEFHRDSIREKLGIKNKKINLRAHLLSFQ